MSNIKDYLTNLNSQTVESTFDDSMLEVIETQEKYQNITYDKLGAWLCKKGLPREVSDRLIEFAEKAEKVGGKVIYYGKILICKIIEFLANNPKTAIGVAVGAILGGSLLFIPFLGPYIMPILTVLGALYGFKLDNNLNSLPEALILAIEKSFVSLYRALKVVLQSAFV